MKFRLIIFRVLFIFSCLQFFVIASFSQNRNIDSLQNLIKLNKNDTNKVINLNRLSRAYLDIGLFDSTIFYSNRALKLCEEKLSGSKGVVYKRFLKSKADGYNNIGIVFAQQAKFPQALDFWLKALKIDEELGNKSGIAARNGNIGNIYWNLKDYKKALFYFFKALKLSREINDQNLIAKWLGNIGNVYREEINNLKNQPEERKALLNKSIDYYFKALKIYDNLNDKIGVARMNGNIGNVYLDFSGDSTISKRTRDSLYDKAKQSINISLSINHEAGNIYEEAIQIGNLGYLNLLMGEYSLAEERMLKAIKIFKELNASEYLRNIEYKISTFYYKINNYKEALLHYEKFVNLNDSIFNSEKNKELVQKEMNFEFNKKEALLKAEQDKKDAISIAEKKRQQSIIYSILFGLLIVLIFSIFLFRLFIQKRKANKLLAQQNAEIIQQKEEILTQRDEIEAQRDLVTNQKNNIEQIHKEVTDSINYAKRIQHAILPSKKLWQKYLPNSFILYQPKDIVAGDFYWLEIKNNEIIFAVADCTGHGVPGAMVSVVCSNSLNRVVNEFNITEPGKILDKTKELVVEHFTKGGDDVKDGMDISICSLCYENNKITLKWAGANNPLWIISSVILNDSEESKVEDSTKQGLTDVLTNHHSFILNEFKPDKQPIGKTDNNVQFKTHIIELQKNDMIYIFSDGFQDQFGGELGKKYKASKMKELLLSITNNTIIEQEKIIANNFKLWKGNLEQVDDICLIGIKI